MSEAKKRTVQTDYEHPERKRRKPEEIQEIPDMSLQCAEVYVLLHCPLTRKLVHHHRV